MVIAELGRGAGLTEDAASGVGEIAVVVDAFAADSARDAGGFIPRHLTGMKRNADPLLLEEIGISKFAIGKHLLLVLVFDMGVQFAGALLGAFEGRDADSLVGGSLVGSLDRSIQVDEGGSHLAPVAELEGALAEAAAGNDGDGIGGAAVDLDEGDEPFAIQSAWFGDAKALAAEHGQANAENLSSAEMAMRDFGLMEKVVEGLHRSDDTVFRSEG